MGGKTQYEALNAAPANNKNQLNGYCHDSAGSLILNAGCPTGSFVPTYSYDAENRMVSNPGATYVYDGDGNRVKKVSSTTTLYWYGATGDALTETDGSGGTVNDYVFFNGKRVARRDATTIRYYFSDHLGSHSLITDANGDMPAQAESDFYPYGGEMVITADSSNNHYKFTSKERDAETCGTMCLDNFGARHDASALGRFVTPDPLLNSGRPWEPQSWNRYAYVLNNPIKSVDANGLYDYDVACKQGAGGDACRQAQDRFDKAVNKARDLLKTMPQDSKEAKTLKKALDTIGTRGDKNGFKVGLGKTDTGSPMEARGQHIQVDWNAVDAGVTQATKANLKPVVDVEDASGLGHEATHLNQPTIPMWAQNRWDIDEGHEREAYRVSSSMSQAGHSDSIYGVWNESWANSADMETIRQQVVKEMGHESMESTRDYWYATGNK